MNLQIVSGEMLLDYQKKYQILLLDLRDYKSYCQGHIAGALWISPKGVQEEIPLLLKHYYYMCGNEPDWIALYCHSGRISLLTAKKLAQMGYPVLSLYGGYDGWKQKQNLLRPLEFHHSL